MKKDELIKVAEQISLGTASDQDIATYNAWYNATSVEADWDENALGTAADKELQLFDKVNVAIQKPRAKKLWMALSGAAAAAVIVAALGISFFSSRSSVVNQKTLVYHNDIEPGKQGATLLLSNGKSVRLDHTNGQIAQEAGVSITKMADGQVVYHLENVKANTNSQNTLITDKGETYAIVLPDKSKVWLNAASKLTFATSLGARGFRKVKLEGEAYFEVEKDKHHPFIVETSGQQIQVLGTHFNVSAYADEPITKTTLLEGKVEVTTNLRNQLFLKPGQQANNAGGQLDLQEVNAASAIAWKNGEFVFNEEPLGSIMLKIARWYNVEVGYSDLSLREKRFGGTISKFKNVSDVLRMLELTKDVNFEIKERRIVVTK